MEYCDVSVVIPYYQAKHTIDRAINSVYNQSLKPKEIVIIDDSGIIDDYKFLEKLKLKYKNLKIQIIRNNQNRGAAYSRNCGWNYATSKYIAFLDSDDSWEPDKLEYQYNFMEKNNAILSGHKLNISRIDLGFQENKVSFRRLLINNQFPTPTVMVRREIEERFDNNKRYVDDHLLWLEITYKYNDRVFLINKPLANVYKAMYGEDGLSSHLVKMEQGELDTYFKLYKKKKINFGILLLFFLFSLAKFLRRIVIVYVNKIKYWRGYSK